MSEREEDLQSLHELNSKKIRELWQREDKRSEAVRLEFWQSRKSFDGQLGRVAERIQKEVLRSERYLLAPWPQSEATRQRLLDALRAWLNEAEQLAKAANRNLRQQEPDPQHFFLLAAWHLI
ncbi:LINE-1 retrotransposable element ORF2 protein [Durusdinium trenchii]|uniref:LINE-1 retrotransposable element ORF2 protein n=1 Tax=Durusdinium trenchii TaxID=1381693 RepID=A0ABP0RGA0_9DINO